MHEKKQRIGKDVKMIQSTNDIYTNMSTQKHVRNNVWTILRVWREFSRQRRELRALSDHMLKDIGISRSDAIREANRAFWDNKPNFDVTLWERGGSNPKVDNTKSNFTCCVQS